MLALYGIKNKLSIVLASRNREFDKINTDLLIHFNTICSEPIVAKNSVRY